LGYYRTDRNDSARKLVTLASLSPRSAKDTGPDQSLNDVGLKLLSQLHTTLYRATGGTIGRRLVNNDMLLLTTTGRRTGTLHTVPLLYLLDGERLVVIASYGGRPLHPQWYLNLLAQPKAIVQTERVTSAVIATTMSPDDRGIWWPRIVTAYGDYANYQARTDREIPVVWLEPHTKVAD